MPGKTVGDMKAASTALDRDARTSARRIARHADNETVADRRALILKTATRLFAEYGFETTTVRQITNEVNILSGSLYHHFTAKEDLLHEIVREGLVRILDENGRIARLPLDPEDKLIALLVYRFTEMTRNPEIHATVSNEAQFFRRSEDFAYVQDLKNASFDIMERVISDGMRDGLFRPELDIYLTIGTISRTIGATARWFNSHLTLARRDPAAYALETIIDFHLGFILGAIRDRARIAEPIAWRAHAPG